MVESSESDRIERLRNELDTLRAQLAEIQIQRMQNEITTLTNQLAEVQSLRQAQASILEYLASQPEAIDEDRIHAAVKNRRVILLKALRRLLADGKVIRTGAGKKASPYRHGTRKPEWRATRLECWYRAF
jgi:hypothetical protein